jgi:hypothetical protein
MVPCHLRQSNQFIMGSFKIKRIGSIEFRGRWSFCEYGKQNQPSCLANKRSHLKIHTILNTDVLCYHAHCMLKITKWSQSTSKFFFVISSTIHKLDTGFMCLCCKFLLLLVSFETYTNFQRFSNTETFILQNYHCGTIVLYKLCWWAECKQNAQNQRWR